MKAFVLTGVLSLLGLVSGQGCPESYGIQTYPHDKYCDRFYKVNYKLRFFKHLA